MAAAIVMAAILTWIPIVLGGQDRITSAMVHHDGLGKVGVAKVRKSVRGGKPTAMKDLHQAKQKQAALVHADGRVEVLVPDSAQLSSLVDAGGPTSDAKPSGSAWQDGFEDLIGLRKEEGKYAKKLKDAETKVNKYAKLVKKYKNKLDEVRSRISDNLDRNSQKTDELYAIAKKNGIICCVVDSQWGRYKCAAKASKCRGEGTEWLHLDDCSGAPACEEVHVCCHWRTAEGPLMCKAQFGECAEFLSVEACAEVEEEGSDATCVEDVRRGDVCWSQDEMYHPTEDDYEGCKPCEDLPEHRCIGQCTWNAKQDPKCQASPGRGRRAG